jgi:hypothetical protein
VDEDRVCVDGLLVAPAARHDLDEGGVRMTAPLPPPSIRLADGGYYSEPLLKLIVREALERAAKKCEEVGEGYDNEWNRKLGYAEPAQEVADDCADAIRATLKEYE